MLKTHTFSYYYLGDNMNKKVLIIVSLLFILVIFYTFSLIPDNTINYNYPVNDSKTIYTVDSDNYVTKTSVYEESNDIRKLLNIMTTNTDYSSLLKSGFYPVIPKNTKVIDWKIDNDVLKINFSKELLDITKDKEEEMIESIIYTVLENSEVEKIQIYVEGNLLKSLPKSGKVLPNVLTKDYGINKTYDFNSYDNINKVLVWFVKEINDEIYYVPVTKYIDDNRNKVEIIIDVLSSRNLYKDNLMSFVDNLSLSSYNINNKNLTLYLENNNKIDQIAVNEIINSLFDSLQLNSVKLFVNKELVGVFKS